MRAPTLEREKGESRYCRLRRQRGGRAGDGEPGAGESAKDGDRGVPDRAEANLGQIDTSIGGILVKAALLLVTAACFTGQAPPAAGGGKPELVKPPAVSPAPVTSTVAPGGCDACADCGHRHFARFGGLFNRNSCDGGCDSCA